MQLFTQDDIQRIAVIGAKSAWAVTGALTGYTVRVCVPDTELNAAHDAVSSTLHSSLEQGLDGAELIALAQAQLHFTDDPSDALLDAQFVVADQPDKALVRTVDTYASPRAVVCCAGLNARHLEGSRHPERWLSLVDGMPVPLISTAPQAFETARMLYLSFFPFCRSLQ